VCRIPKARCLQNRMQMNKMKSLQSEYMRPAPMSSLGPTRSLNAPDLIFHEAERGKCAACTQLNQMRWDYTRCRSQTRSTYNQSIVYACLNNLIISRSRGQLLRQTKYRMWTRYAVKYVIFTYFYI
jgi:hypothetical protein